MTNQNQFPTHVSKTCEKPLAFSCPRASPFYGGVIDLRSLRLKYYTNSLQAEMLY